MDGIPKSSQSGSSKSGVSGVPPSTDEKKQSEEKKGVVPVDADASVGKAADKGEGKQGGKTLFNRSVSQTSQTSVKSDDSAFEEGESVADTEYDRSVSQASVKSDDSAFEESESVAGTEFDRSVSQTSVKSDDSGFAGRSKGIADTELDRDVSQTSVKSDDSAFEGGKSVADTEFDRSVSQASVKSDDPAFEEGESVVGTEFDRSISQTSVKSDDPAFEEGESVVGTEFDRSISQTSVKSDDPAFEEGESVVGTEFDRSISQTSVKSDDPVFEEGKSVADKQLSSSTYNKLSQAIGDNPDLADALNQFKKASDNYVKIEAYLKSDEHTAKEKQAYLAKESGLFSHMTRADEPTSPATVINAIEGMLFMLNEVANFEEQKCKTVTEKLLSADGPCFEARFTEAQNVYAKETGLFDPDDSNKLELDSLLNSAHESGKILDGMFEKYMGEKPEELTPDGEAITTKFSDWVREQDGVVGFKAKGGDITLDKIGIYCKTMVKAYLMVEPE